MASGRGARPPLVLTLVGVGMLVALAFPLAAAHALATWGPRTVGGAVLLLGLASLTPSLLRAPAAAPPGESGAADVARLLPRLGRWPRLVPLLLPALALLSGDERFLQLFPVAVEAMLAALFLASLRGGRSILQQAALTLEPYAPAFIGPYCRKATLAFAVLFLGQALVLAALVFPKAAPDWGHTASLVVWVPTLVGTALEFAVRKAWFRHYGNGPVDRVLRMLMPPENTARGRRSLEYIRRMRLELGLPPPPR